MTTPRQKILFDLMTAAKDKPKGIAIVLKSPAEAERVRFRFYKLRERMRKHTYPERDKIEALVMTLEENKLIITPGTTTLEGFTVIDRETGDNVTGKFEYVDEVVSFSEEDFLECLK